MVGKTIVALALLATWAHAEEPTKLASPNNVWAFGWTQLLTILGLLITVSIATIGFRTFNKWRREKIEERRIEVAFEALEIAYQTKFVFQNIRSPVAEGWEWANMERRNGETDDAFNRRGPFYATFERIKANKDFFQRAWTAQPRCMAVFGSDIENTFLKLHRARRHVEVAAQMLAQRQTEHYGGPNDQATRELYEQLRRDMSDHGDFEPERDRVARLIREFISEVEAAARPLVDRQLTKTDAFLSWVGLRRS
jgi:hypothetical protein